MQLEFALSFCIGLGSEESRVCEISPYPGGSSGDERSKTQCSSNNSRPTNTQVCTISHDISMIYCTRLPFAFSTLSIIVEGLERVSGHYSVVVIFIVDLDFQ